jgi:hypothetical protein
MNYVVGEKEVDIRGSNFLAVLVGVLNPMSMDGEVICCMLGK